MTAENSRKSLNTDQKESLPPALPVQGGRREQAHDFHQRLWWETENLWGGWSHRALWAIWLPPPECDNIFNVSTSCLLLHKSPENEFLMAENEPHEEIKEFFFLFRNMTLKSEMCSERRICLGSVHHRTVWDFYPLWESSRVSLLPLLWAFCSHSSEPAVSCSFQPQISFLPPLWVEGIKWDLGENSPYQPGIGQDGNLGEGDAAEANMTNE